MRKQEFIHVHSLLAEVATQCRENGIDINLDEYRALETRPTSIQLSKTAHKEAVFALTEAVNSQIADERQEAVAASAD